LVSSSVSSVTPLASIPGISFPNPLYVDSLTPIEEEEAPPTNFFFSKKKREIIKGGFKRRKLVR
jgi:hypothetical protein